MKEMMNILCDRDGTIIYDRHYLSDPAGVELLPDSASGLRRLGAAGARLFVVTNQSGIGRGMFAEEDYLACAARLDSLLDEQGVRIADSVFCPHAPDENGRSGCRCRKPGPGLWLELKRRHGLDESVSAMIGDKPEDVAFGAGLGFAESILVLTGKGMKSAAGLGLPELPPGADFMPVDGARSGGVAPTCVARSIDSAADYLLAKYIFPYKGR